MAEAITPCRSNTSSAEFPDRLKSFVPLSGASLQAPRCWKTVVLCGLSSPRPPGRSVRDNIGVQTGREQRRRAAFSPSVSILFHQLTRKDLHGVGAALRNRRDEAGGWGGSKRRGRRTRKELGKCVVGTQGCARLQRQKFSR